MLLINTISYCDTTTMVKQHFPKGFKLIYLTLDGHEASKDSLGDEEIDYHCISYDEHILYWLSQCVMLAYDKPSGKRDYFPVHNTY